MSPTASTTCRRSPRTVRSWSATAARSSRRPTAGVAGRRGRAAPSWRSTRCALPTTSTPSSRGRTASCVTRLMAGRAGRSRSRTRSSTTRTAPSIPSTSSRCTRSTRITPGRWGTARSSPRPATAVRRGARARWRWRPTSRAARAWRPRIRSSTTSSSWTRRTAGSSASSEKSCTPPTGARAGTSRGRRRGSAPSSGRTCSPGCAGSASPTSRTAGWSADTASSIGPPTAARPGCRRKAETGEPAMSSGTTSEEEDKRALYWLGERLIDYRHPVMIVVMIVTGYFAYLSSQLKLETSFGDLLPQSHPFVQIHNKYAGTFGGANNIQLMVEVKEGDIFTVSTLDRIYKITEEMDRVYGVNHNQIDSIGHRTTRYLRAQAGGFLKAEPVMIQMPKTADDAANIKRIVHNTESIYGILVSLDDRAALVRANFIESRLDHRRTFSEINENVIAPFQEGWIGAMIKGRDPLKPDQNAPAVVDTVYRGTAAADAGIKVGDTIVSVNGKPVGNRAELAAAIKPFKPGTELSLGVQRGEAVETAKLMVP